MSTILCVGWTLLALPAEAFEIAGDQIVSIPTTSLEVEFFVNLDLEEDPLQLFDYNVTLELTGPGAGTDVRISSCGDTSSPAHPQARPLDVTFVETSSVRCFGGTVNLPLNPGDPPAAPFAVNDQQGFIRAVLDVSPAARGDYTISVVRETEDDTQLIDESNQILTSFADVSGMVTILSEMPDINSDGFVDIFDLAIVSENWNQSGTLGIAGDANFDGEVDIFDVATISENWNPPAGAASVPEPFGLGMMSVALGWAFLTVRRLKRQQRRSSPLHR